MFQFLYITEHWIVNFMRSVQHFPFSRNVNIIPSTLACRLKIAIVSSIDFERWVLAFDSMKV